MSQYFDHTYEGTRVITKTMGPAVMTGFMELQRFQVRLEDPSRWALHKTVVGGPWMVVSDIVEGAARHMAELVGGEIVELEKDCCCGHHTGPHWIEEQREWNRRNKYRNCDGNMDHAGETARLDSRAKIFERLNISRIFVE